MKRLHSSLPDRIERLATQIVDACYTVHREMGPGLLESVYEDCLCREFNLRRMPFGRQVPVPLKYKGAEIASPLRLDLLVDDTIILELKCVHTLEPVHEAQILSYLRLASKPLGFLVNFHVQNIGSGIRRYVMSGNNPPNSEHN
ncbi:MAG: GxxExxY protein [Bacteroidota bacterium]|jgi:GxxExxY protein|nr:GxxExxY protein [Bacteroidota bacterium]